MKNLGLMTLLVVIFVIMAEVQTVNVYSLTSQTNVINPLIIEYISSFKVGTKDLPDAIANQYKNITLSVIKTSYAELHQTTMSIKYVGTQKTVKDLSPVKVYVANDSLAMSFNFTVIVFHIIGNKTYHCSTTIPLISVNYTKEVDFASSVIMTDSLFTDYSYKSFTVPICTDKKQSDKDKSRILEAVIATEGASLYLQLKKLIDKMQSYFNINTKTQHLSKLYETNPYLYTYYEYQIKLNVSTVSATSYHQGGISNGILATITNTTHLAGTPPAYLHPYSGFYSLQFIQNMIQYSIYNYPKWRNIKLSRSNMRNRVFKYRLVDMEYIVPNLLLKYPKLYLNDIQITCTVSQMLDSSLTEKYFIQRLKWRCSGSFQVTADKRQTFLDFYPIIDYSLVITTNTNYINVVTNQVQLVSLLFNPLTGYQVKDQVLATNYLQQGLFEFRVPTIGGFFKVDAKNNMIKLVPGEGIWIG